MTLSTGSSLGPQDGEPGQVPEEQGQHGRRREGWNQALFHKGGTYNEDFYNSHLLSTYCVSGPREELRVHLTA